MTPLLRAAALALVFAFTLIAPTAHATLLVVRSLAELVADSDHIVVITGVSETSRRDRFGRIVSDMQLLVNDVAKGSLRRGQAIVVTRLGGSIGDLAMTVAGEAHVTTGERAVLFLDNVGSNGAMRVSSMALGQFPIVSQHGVDTVLPSGAGLSLVIEGEDGALSPTAGPLQSPLPLREFLSVVSSLAVRR